MNLDLSEIKVKIWVISNPSGNERGIATLKFGQFYISGFRIMKNDEAHKGATEYWVAPPAYRTRKGKFQTIFWLADKELWQEIQKKVLQEYESLLARKPELKSDQDDIPIIDEEGFGNYSKRF